MKREVKRIFNYFVKLSFHIHRAFHDEIFKFSFLFVNCFTLIKICCHILLYRTYNEQNTPLIVVVVWILKMFCFEGKDPVYNLEIFILKIIDGTNFRYLKVLFFSNKLRN